MYATLSQGYGQRTSRTNYSAAAQNSNNVGQSNYSAGSQNSNNFSQSNYSNKLKGGFANPGESTRYVQLNSGRNNSKNVPYTDNYQPKYQQRSNQIDVDRPNSVWGNPTGTKQQDQINNQQKRTEQQYAHRNDLPPEGNYKKGSEGEWQQQPNRRKNIGSNNQQRNYRNDNQRGHSSPNNNTRTKGDSRYNFKELIQKLGPKITVEWCLQNVGDDDDKKFEMLWGLLKNVPYDNGGKAYEVVIELTKLDPKTKKDKYNFFPEKLQNKRDGFTFFHCLSYMDELPADHPLSTKEPGWFDSLVNILREHNCDIFTKNNYDENALDAVLSNCKKYNPKGKISEKETMQRYMSFVLIVDGQVKSIVHKILSIINPNIESRNLIDRIRYLMHMNQDLTLREYAKGIVNSLILDISNSRDPETKKLVYREPTPNFNLRIEFLIEACNSVSNNERKAKTKSSIDISLDIFFAQSKKAFDLKIVLETFWNYVLEEASLKSDEKSQWPACVIGSICGREFVNARQIMMPKFEEYLNNQLLNKNATNLIRAIVISKYCTPHVFKFLKSELSRVRDIQEAGSVINKFEMIINYIKQDCPIEQYMCEDVDEQIESGVSKILSTINPTIEGRVGIDRLRHLMHLDQDVTLKNYAKMIVNFSISDIKSNRDIKTKKITFQEPIPNFNLMIEFLIQASRVVSDETRETALKLQKSKQKFDTSIDTSLNTFFAKSKKTFDLKLILETFWNYVMKEANLKKNEKSQWAACVIGSMCRRELESASKLMIPRFEEYLNDQLPTDKKEGNSTNSMRAIAAAKYCTPVVFKFLENELVRLENISGTGFTRNKIAIIIDFVKQECPHEHYLFERKEIDIDAIHDQKVEKSEEYNQHEKKEIIVDSFIKNNGDKDCDYSEYFVLIRHNYLMDKEEGYTKFDHQDYVTSIDKEIKKIESKLKLIAGDMMVCEEIAEIFIALIENIPSELINVVVMDILQKMKDVFRNLKIPKKNTQEAFKITRESFGKLNNSQDEIYGRVKKSFGL